MNDAILVSSRKGLFRLSRKNGRWDSATSRPWTTSTQSKNASGKGSDCSSTTASCTLPVLPQGSLSAEGTAAKARSASAKWRK